MGAVHFIASFRAALTMLTFYLTSSKLTRWCEERKDDDEDFKKGGQRDWAQVTIFGPNLALHILQYTAPQSAIVFGTREGGENRGWQASSGRNYVGTE